jgi:hypothetical protein
MNIVKQTHRTRSLYVGENYFVGLKTEDVNAIFKFMGSVIGMRIS